MPKETINGASVTWTRGGKVVQLFTEQYVDLDRHAINRLIRVARAARDQAFGKDE